MSLLETLQDALPDALTGGGEDDTDPDDEQPDEPEDEDADGADESSGGFMGGGGDEDADELRDDLNDLEYEVRELRDEIESVESSMRSVESRQDELEGDMDNANDRIRKVLGIYDQFVEGDNPFQGNNTAQTSSPTPSDKDRTEDTDDTDDETGDELTVQDLRDRVGLEDPDDDTEDDENEEEDSDTQSTGNFEGVLDDETYLTKPPLTYAGEVVAFEWLSHLMGESGSAGALKAMDFYENLGWLSPEVRDYMITLLSAPAIDVDAETQSPEELSSETHKQSFRYIMKMSSVNREYVKEQSVRNN